MKDRTVYTAPAELRNKQIVLQRRTEAPDPAGTGQLLETWSDVGDPLWAKIEPLSGRKLWLARQAQARSTHEITILYRRDVEEQLLSWRARRLDGRVLNFESALNRDSLNEELVIMAIEEENR